MEGRDCDGPACGMEFGGGFVRNVMTEIHTGILGVQAKDWIREIA